MNTHTYRVIIEPDENDTFHAYVPALPGCHTWGESLFDAREKIRDAMTAYLAVLAEDNEVIPKDIGFEMVETVALPARKEQHRE